MPAYRTRDTQSRPLEVTTDAPLPPTVSIISPTPRAFSFPINTDIPYASPSTSPFEPELKPISATPPPMRPFSPTTSTTGSESSSIYSSSSTQSSQVSHRRRRSTVSDNERRPKKGDEDYIKRPENAFILFRRKCCEERQIAMEEASDDSSVSAPVKKQRQADLSKTISQQWKSLSSEERQKWEDLAKEKKREHEQLYPNYVYRPQRVKKAKKGKGKKTEEGEGEGEAISFVVPVPSPPRSLSRDAPIEQSRVHARRAISAPTPPPAYQTIQLPTVNFPPRPSCPSSPTHVPSISLSRRTSYIPPPTAADPSTHFEYLPNDTVLPPTMQRSNFETTFSYDFQNYQFDGQFRNPGVPPPQALSIPPEQTSYMCSQLVSPAESIASSLYSPADSIASSMSPSSANAPYTPAESLSMSALSLGPRASISMGCVPENPSAEAQEPEYGYAGSTSWSPTSLWHDANAEALMNDDFDLNSIPPIELGTTMPEPVSQCEMEQPYGAMPEEPEYNETTPSHDPFASLFTFDNMNW